MNQRLVEVEYILKKLDNEYINKIPQEIWNYIEENKDKEYVFKYDESKTLVEQNLSIDTIAILTYINMEYLLDEQQKKEMQEILKNDERIAEEEKKKKYSVDEIFKNKEKSPESKVEETKKLIEYKESTIKQIWNKILDFFHIKK